jgi:hypothetical protein
MLEGVHTTQEGEWVMKGKLGALGAVALAAMMLLSGCGSANAHKTAAAAKPEISGTYVIKGNLDDKLVFNNGVLAYSEEHQEYKATYSISDKPVANGLYSITMRGKSDWDDGGSRCMISDKPSKDCAEDFDQDDPNSVQLNYVLNELLIQPSKDGSKIELFPYLPDFAPSRLKGTEQETNIPWSYPDTKTTKDWKSFQEPDRMTLIRQ